MATLTIIIVFSLVAVFVFGYWFKFYRSKRYKRNCNRFDNETDAWNAFVDETGYKGELEDDKFVPTEYVYWLFEEKK